MAVCKAAWCDFMAVCTKTKEICLKRVFFCDSYWKAVAEKLKQFIVVFQVIMHTYCYYSSFSLYLVQI